MHSEHDNPLRRLRDTALQHLPFGRKPSGNVELELSVVQFSNPTAESTLANGMGGVEGPAGPSDIARRRSVELPIPKPTRRPTYYAGPLASDSISLPNALATPQLPAVLADASCNSPSASEVNSSPTGSHPLAGDQHEPADATAAAAAAAGGSDVTTAPATGHHWSSSRLMPSPSRQQQQSGVAPRSVAFAQGAATHAMTPSALRPCSSGHQAPAPGGSAGPAGSSGAAGNGREQLQFDFEGASTCGSSFGSSTAAAAKVQDLPSRGASPAPGAASSGPLPPSGSQQLDKYLDYLLSQQHPHKFLYYPGWGLPLEGCAALGEFLRRDNRIKVMTLSGNKITDDGVELLADGLKDNSTLLNLDLSDNKIGEMGAIALAEALHANNTLKELQLNNNRIGDEGAEALAAAVANCALKKLTLQGNYISAGQLKVVAHVLKTRTYRMPHREDAPRSKVSKASSHLQFDIELSDNVEELHKTPALQQLHLPPATAVAALSEPSGVMESSLQLQALQVVAELAAATQQQLTQQQQQQEAAGDTPTGVNSGSTSSLQVPHQAQPSSSPAPAETAQHSAAPAAATAASAAAAAKQVEPAVPDAILVPRLAQCMARLGYDVSIRRSNPGDVVTDAGGEGRPGVSLRSSSHTVIRVSQPGELTAPVIVDPYFKEQFQISHPSKRYAEVLDALPQVLVLHESRLWHLVELLCREMAAAFHEQGSSVPPWRAPVIMVNKWLPSHYKDMVVPYDASSAALSAAFKQLQATGRPAAATS